MWGINPVVVGQILGSVLIKEVGSGQHGLPKIIRDKIVVCAANQEIELAKAMARSVARQDQGLYEELQMELKSNLSDEEWRQIFA